MAGRSTLKANATPREKFIHYANIRATAAITAITNLGKLAENPTEYQFTAGDAATLTKALTDATAAMTAAFASPGKKGASGAKIIS
jgi:hypothetical protein